MELFSLELFLVCFNSINSTGGLHRSNCMVGQFYAVGQLLFNSLQIHSAEILSDFAKYLQYI